MASRTARPDSGHSPSDEGRGRFQRASTGRRDTASATLVPHLHAVRVGRASASWPRIRYCSGSHLHGGYITFFTQTLHNCGLWRDIHVGQSFCARIERFFFIADGLGLRTLRRRQLFQPALAALDCRLLCGQRSDGCRQRHIGPGGLCRRLAAVDTAGRQAAAPWAGGQPDAARSSGAGAVRAGWRIQRLLAGHADGRAVLGCGPGAGAHGCCAGAAGPERPSCGLGDEWFAAGHFAGSQRGGNGVGCLGLAGCLSRCGTGDGCGGAVAVEGTACIAQPQPGQLSPGAVQHVGAVAHPASAAPAHPGQRLGVCLGQRAVFNHGIAIVQRPLGAE